MKVAIAPFIVLGFLAGWLANALIFGPRSEIAAGSVLTALVTVMVGFFIQSAVRREGELDKIPVECVSRSIKIIEELVNKCINHVPDTKVNDRDLVQQLTLLGNEVAWFGDVVKISGVDAAEYAAVEADYFVFKAALTGGDDRTEPDFIAASEWGRLIRGRCLVLQAKVSRSLIANPDCLQRLFSKPGE